MKKKLEKLLEYTGLKILPFSKAVGQGSQTFYDIRAGKIQSFTLEVANKISAAFPEINRGWLLNESDEMFKRVEESKALASMFNETPERAEQFLNIIPLNSKGKNINEGKIVPEKDIIKIKTYIIPIKGFAGLKNALFDEEYIMKNFEEQTTEVPKEYYSHLSYKVQSMGDSMNRTIPNGAWVTSVPIPEQDWLGYKFREDRVYALFHPFRGILFKNVRNIAFGEIMLMSENEDKIEYPDEMFKITEFRKICIGIKVETFI